MAAVEVQVKVPTDSPIAQFLVKPVLGLVAGAAAWLRVRRAGRP